jgi:hypothetical protein
MIDRPKVEGCVLDGFLPPEFLAYTNRCRVLLGIDWMDTDGSANVMRRQCCWAFVRAGLALRWRLPLRSKRLGEGRDRRVTSERYTHPSCIYVRVISDMI